MITDNFGGWGSNGSCYHAVLEGDDPKKFKVINVYFMNLLI